jgi:hypothetical protein
MSGFRRLLSPASVSDTTEPTISLRTDSAQSTSDCKQAVRKQAAHDGPRSEDIRPLLELFRLLAGWNEAEEWRM